MDTSQVDDVIDSCHFIRDDHKDHCKEYFKQVPKGLGDWFYANSLPSETYQGDIVDRFDVIFLITVDGQRRIQVFDAIPCILLSSTCDIYQEGKTREKYISLAPVISFEEFSNNRPPDFPEPNWDNFLSDIKANRITNILYVPGKTPLPASVIFLDKICSVDPATLLQKLHREESKVILSLSQTGWYYFLIKLTYHFARFEDPAEIARN